MELQSLIQKIGSFKTKVNQLTSSSNNCLNQNNPRESYPYLMQNTNIEQLNQKHPRTREISLQHKIEFSPFNVNNSDVRSSLIFSTINHNRRSNYEVSGQD